MSTSIGRGVWCIRFGIVFVVLLAIYLLRDIWLESQYYQHTDEPAPAIPFTSPEPALPSSPIQHTEPEVAIEHNHDLLQQSESSSRACINAPGAENVMVILKTGATELYQKLPIHIATTFKCIRTSNLLIASDLEQSFADYTIFDAIAPISKEYRDHHPDFELYRKLQQYQREGQDMRSLQGDVSWNLDKWKFLPMLHRAFETTQDNIEWFVIIEADTSLSWTNLLQWLKTMDPKEPLYLGSQNFIGSTAFAHGGSGIVISRKAADMLEEVREEEGKADYDTRWEDNLAGNCCGDEVIGRALLEANVQLTPSWPPIQGETVASLDWTDKHWCAPAISWHHVSPSELDALWQFERAWVDGHGWNEPYLFRDVFAHFIERHVSVNRTKWNNLSKERKFVNESLATSGDEDWSYLHDSERAATESEEACAQACIHPIHDDCIQWMFSPGRCYLGYEIRFGKSDEREEEHWTSGWIQEKLEKFKYKHRGCRVRWSGADD